MKQYKHKITGAILTMVKRGDTVSKLLVANNPTKKFYDMTIPNNCICLNENLVAI